MCIKIPDPSSCLCSRDANFLHFLLGNGLFFFLVNSPFFSVVISNHWGIFRGFLSLWNGCAGASSFGNDAESSNLVLGRAWAACEIDWTALAILVEARSSSLLFVSAAALCLPEDSAPSIRRSKPLSLWKGVNIPFLTSASLSYETDNMRLARELYMLIYDKRCIYVEWRT